MKRFLVPVLAYAVPTFALGFVRHLVLFERYYADSHCTDPKNEGALRP
jgi:hypothetical protein